eukprot:COSAG01_NODE_60326_length_295_cov_1.051020_1_plen_39_part_01
MDCAQVKVVKYKSCMVYKFLDWGLIGFIYGVGLFHTAVD